MLLQLIFAEHARQAGLPVALDADNLFAARINKVNFVKERVAAGKNTQLVGKFGHPFTLFTFIGHIVPIVITQQGGIVRQKVETIARLLLQTLQLIGGFNGIARHQIVCFTAVGAACTVIAKVANQADRP